MNDPVISPWIFYFLGLLTPLQLFFFFSASISFIIGCIAFLHLFDCEDWVDRYKGENAFYNKKLKKASRIFYVTTIFFIFSTVMSIFLPDKNTVVQMIVASKVTPANIDKAADIGEKAIDKIINKVIEASQKFENRSNKGK